MIRKTNTILKSEKGQAVVEAALVLPLLLLFLCMIIDVGRIVYFESRLNSVCQETVRIVGLGGTTSDAQNYVTNQLGSAPAIPGVYVDPGDSVRKSGDFVTVTISDNINYITPLANVILPSPFTAVAKSTIRVE